MLRHTGRQTSLLAAGLDIWDVHVRGGSPGYVTCRQPAIRAALNLAHLLNVREGQTVLLSEGVCSPRVGEESSKGLPDGHLEV